MEVFAEGKARLLTAALALVLLVCSGCLATRRSDTTTRGREIATGELAGLTEGKTTRADIVGAFGAPTQTLALGEGKELLVYVYEQEEKAHGSIFLLYGWNSTTTRVVRFNFELQDGVLARYWTEGL